MGYGFRVLADFMILVSCWGCQHLTGALIHERSMAYVKDHGT